jgi:hypothetical protein
MISLDMLLTCEVLLHSYNTIHSYKHNTDMYERYDSYYTWAYILIRMLLLRNSRLLILSKCKNVFGTVALSIEAPS